MKSVLLSVCLLAPAISAPTTLDVTRVSNSEGDVATDRHEVHAVVVDMPQRASLSYASPETWGTLPMSDTPYEQSPYEQSPATTVLQVAMN